MGDSDQQQQLRMMGLQAEAGQEADHQGGTQPSAEALQQQGNAAILRMMGAPSEAGQAQQQHGDAPKPAHPAAHARSSAMSRPAYIITSPNGMVAYRPGTKLYIDVPYGYQMIRTLLEPGAYWYDGRGYIYKGPTWEGQGWPYVIN